MGCARRKTAEAFLRRTRFAGDGLRREPLGGLCSADYRTYAVVHPHAEPNPELRLSPLAILHVPAACGGLTASYSVPNVALPSLLNEFPGTVLTTTIPFDPAPADFGSYEGIGTNSYQLAYGAGTFSGSTTAPSGVGFGGDANASGTASVTYAFVPVPEPATIMLLASGFLAVGGFHFVGRRRGRVTGSSLAC